MYSKLGIINTALALTGNSVVAVDDDGSAEWNVGSAAYEAGVKYLIGEHDWKFGTAIETLTRTGDSGDDFYGDRYARPQTSLGLIWVRVEGIPADWKIIGNEVHTNAAAGTTVTAKVVLEPDPEAWPPLFVKALDAYTRAGIYDGLNEDTASGRSWREEGEIYLARARTRTDREDSPRRVFKSRILARRRGAPSRASDWWR